MAIDSLCDKDERYVAYSMCGIARVRYCITGIRIYIYLWREGKERSVTNISLSVVRTDVRAL